MLMKKIWNLIIILLLATILLTGCKKWRREKNIISTEKVAKK